MSSDPTFDALVIGGGPAGLTGALYLARFRRKVMLIDDGASRALRIPRSHNMPGYPNGVPGAKLVAAIREQAARYGVTLASGRVASLVRDADGFVVAEWPGRRERARLVLLATGTSDNEPPIPDLAQAVQTGAVRYCPVCDGYEVIDRAVGVIADGASGVREALYLRDFTPHLTVFPVSPDVRFGEADRRRLTESGIALVDEPVISIRQWRGTVTVRHGAGQTRCDSLYSALGQRVHCELVPGADRDEDGYLITDRHLKTSIEGIYAAGDVAKGLNQISVAIGEAAIAASAMHLALRAAGVRTGG